MFEFLHPGFLAGAALISAPILIHLINRMRFKRVRWAAMEFLLKSQKRNRRRLLLEQLLLLGLRCLLVLLAVLLLARARFNFDFTKPLSTVHVVLFDDSLSMGDRWPDKNAKGGQTDCFAAGRRIIIDDIARNAQRAGSAQRLALVYLSRPDVIAFNERLNEQSIRDLENELGKATVTPLHLDLVKGLEPAVANDKAHVVPTLLGEAGAASTIAPETSRYLLGLVILVLGLGLVLGVSVWAVLAASRPVALGVVGLSVVIGLGGTVFLLSRVLDLTQTDANGALSRHVLHVVTDLRQRDWSEPGVGRLNETLARLADPKKNIRINLIDTANPARKTGSDDPSGNVPPYHANLSLVEFRPETRVAAQTTPVQFNVAVANYGISERNNVRVTFKVNGGQRLESITFPKLAPGQRDEKTFLMNFQGAGYHQVSANLDADSEAEGLLADNVRYAVIKVIDRIPLLFVDGDADGGRLPGGDTFQLQALFNKDVFKGYDVQRGGVRDLEKADLDQYATIYLLNVREFSDPAIATLQRYLRDGGSVAFFLGDKVDPDHYTAKLYRKGDGIFPAPLDRAVKPPDDPQERNRLREERLNDGQVKLYVREPKNQVVAEVNKFRSLFSLLLIEGHYPVPRVNWPPKPGVTGSVAGPIEELASLPNARAVREFEGQARQLLGELQAEEAKTPDVAGRLKFHREAIDEALKDKPLTELARALEELLQDAGETDKPERPNLVAFFNQPDQRALRRRLDGFRETVQYGDPLILSRSYGKGRVVAFLTTAGQAWNNWASGEPVMTTYPILIGELQKYLTGGGEEARLVGEAVPFERDGARFAGGWRGRFFPEGSEEGKPASLLPGADKNLDAGSVSFGKKSRDETDRERLSLTFDQARKPGVYLVDVLPTEGEEGQAKGKPERHALVFNVDTAAESDLQRAARSKLEEAGPGVAPGKVQVLVAGAAGFKDLAQRQTDLSESPWLYLGILLVLVFEQALAVHLSFNLAGKAAATPGQLGRPRPAVA